MEMIKLVITDLDNTIYNWVDSYVLSFNAMVSELQRLSGIDERKLRDGFKAIHRKYRTTEYAFAIEQLDVLPEVKQGISTEQIRERYDSAICAFRRVRNETLDR